VELAIHIIQQLRRIPTMTDDKSPTLSGFDAAIERMGQYEPNADPDKRFIREALVDVLDTAEMVCRWMVDNRVPFQAADLIAATALVLERAAKLKAPAERR
jgi:hypothetical protein